VPGAELRGGFTHDRVTADGSVQNSQRLRGHLWSDAVAADDSEVEGAGHAA
jgi:hypothetical protein